MNMNELGNKELRECYDGKIHECTCKDYLLIINGKTRRNAYTLEDELGFYQFGCRAHGYAKNVDTQEELDSVLVELEERGLEVLELRPIYRITDYETNRIGF